MTTLEDEGILVRLASDGTIWRNFDFPSHFHEAWAAVKDLPALPGAVERVVIAGMGGSAIAGDFVQALAAFSGRLPISVVRGYSLPEWTDSRTLVLACSHSGNTEETLSAFEQAIERHSLVVAISSGGKLSELCHRHGVPLLQYDFPPEPRSAFGHSFARMLAVLEKIDALRVGPSVLESAIQDLFDLGASLHPAAPEHLNSARQLARRMEGKVPLIIGAEHLAPVARRWKTQLNENAKVTAFWEEIPEFNHNSIVGLNLPQGAGRLVYAVLLEDAHLDSRVRQRLKLTSDLLSEAGIDHERYVLTGSSRISTMLQGVYMSNAVSVYLALINGVEPSEITAINWIKAQLARVNS